MRVRVRVAALRATAAVIVLPAALACQGALVGSLAGTKLDTGVDPASLVPLIDFWEDVRGVYRPFESGQLSGSSDVYDNEVTRVPQHVCVCL